MREVTVYVCVNNLNSYEPQVFKSLKHVRDYIQERHDENAEDPVVEVFPPPRTNAELHSLIPGNIKITDDEYIFITIGSLYTR